MHRHADHEDSGSDATVAPVSHGNALVFVGLRGTHAVAYASRA